MHAQLLAAEPPTDLLGTVQHLTLVQDDPTAAVAPSAELVMWSRLGSAYAPGGLRDAVADGGLVEMSMLLRPGEDVALRPRWPPGPAPAGSRTGRSRSRQRDGPRPHTAGPGRRGGPTGGARCHPGRGRPGAVVPFGVMADLDGNELCVLRAHTQQKLDRWAARGAAAGADRL